MDLAAHLYQAWSVPRSRTSRFRKLTSCGPLAVTLGGAILFLIFGCVYSYEAIYYEEVAEVVLGGADALITPA